MLFKIWNCDPSNCGLSSFGFHWVSFLSPQDTCFLWTPLLLLLQFSLWLHLTALVNKLSLKLFTCPLEVPVKPLLARDHLLCPVERHRAVGSYYNPYFTQSTAGLVQGKQRSGYVSLLILLQSRSPAVLSCPILATNSRTSPSRCLKSLQLTVHRLYQYLVYLLPSYPALVISIFQTRKLRIIQIHIWPILPSSHPL